MCGRFTLTASIHDRMPVILKRGDEKNWLNPSISDVTVLNKLLKQFNENWMEQYEVSSLVNSPKNNSIELIQKNC